MKKSFILSALVGLAMTATAAPHHIDQISPKPFSPETLVAGQPMYPIQVLHKGKEIYHTEAPGSYMLFSSTGNVDKNTWCTYTVSEEVKTGTGEVTVEKKPQVVGSFGIAAVEGKFYPTISIGLTSSEIWEFEWDYTYTQTMIEENLMGGSYYTTAKWQFVNGNERSNTHYSWVSEQNLDGTYFLAPAPKGAEDVLQPENFLKHAHAYKFVGEAQYNFHYIAQCAADFARTTAYRGGCYDELKAACETGGAQWTKQYFEVDRLFKLFTAQVMALNTEMDNVNFGQIEFDNNGNVIITAAEGDVVKLSVRPVDPTNAYNEYNEYFSFDAESSVKKTIATVGADGTVSVPVYYIPEAVEYMNNATRVHKAMIHVVIEGANSKFLTKSPSFDIEVCGVNPAMSFNNDAVQKKANLAVTSWEKSEKIVFYTAGYDLANEATEGTITNEWFRADNDKNIHNKPIATIEGKDADKFAVEIAPCEDEDILAFTAPGIKAWTATVTLTTQEIDIFDARVIINDTYNKANDLTLYVNAGNVYFEVVSENPERGINVNDKYAANVTGIDFPLEGGVKTVQINACNFKGVNAHKKIFAKSSNGDVFTVFFEGSAVGEWGSACLEGNPQINVDIICEPATEKGITTGEITFFINDKEVVIPVTRTYPTLVRNIYNKEKDVWGVTAEELNIHEGYDEAKIVELGGANKENYQHEVEFILKDLVNYYDIDDLEIYTDQSVFTIDRTARHFMKDGNPFVTINLVYTPCAYDHSVDHGHLFVRIPGKAFPDNCIVVELKGIADPAADPAKGETDGIVGIAADKAANKTVYTISGARASKSTKGLVIENGVKVAK